MRTTVIAAKEATAYPVVLTKVDPCDVPPQSRTDKFADEVVMPGKQVHIFGQSSLQ
jgi:hypothetical protein